MNQQNTTLTPSLQSLIKSTLHNKITEQLISAIRHRLSAPGHATFNEDFHKELLNRVSMVGSSSLNALHFRHSFSKLTINRTGKEKQGRNEFNVVIPTNVPKEFQEIYDFLIMDWARNNKINSFSQSQKNHFDLDDRIPVAHISYYEIKETPSFLYLYIYASNFQEILTLLNKANQEILDICTEVKKIAEEIINNYKENNGEKIQEIFEFISAINQLK